MHARHVTWVILMTALGSVLGCATSANGIHDCSDGVDNDGDGLYDQADPGCAANGVSESPDPTPAGCNNGVDDDGDGLIDFPADPGCHSGDDASEHNVIRPQCNDGLDNDGDGLIDYPWDPGCIAPQADVELDPCPGAGCPACGNGVDDDGDGVIDYPDDIGCDNAADPDESKLAASLCGNQVVVAPLPESGEVVLDMEAGQGELASPVCGGTGRERVYTVEAAQPKALFITTDLPATTMDTVLHMRSSCRLPETELACNDDASQGLGSAIQVILEPGSYWLIVDSYDRQAAGDIHLQVSEHIAPGRKCDAGAPASCLPGYHCQPRDSTTTDTTCELPRCSNGLDDDGDGATDHPADTGCASAADNSELDG